MAITVNERIPVTGRPHVLTAQWVLPVSGAPIENGFVAWTDDRIVALGPLGELPSEWPNSPPMRGSLISPGLINCHAHLEQSFPQPIAKAPDQPFTQWLLAVVAMVQRHAAPEEKAQRCLRGAEELLCTGTTCVNDIASGPESLHVLAAKGLRGIVSLEVFHPAVAPLTVEPWVQRYLEFKAGFEDHPRLQVGLSPHSPYNVSPAAWKALLTACQPGFIHTHLAEFPDEARYLRGEPSVIPDLHRAILKQTYAPQAPAPSPVTYLQQFGLLNANTMTAHAIETNPEDRALLAKAGTRIAHCPRSNLALHGKTLSEVDCPGLPLGLGTDGRLSTEDLDLRGEARLAQSLHGWNAKRTLEALTLHGAMALHLEQSIGSLDIGKQADFVLWQAPESLADSPEALLLSASTTVEQVWIAGGCQWCNKTV